MIRRSGGNPLFATEILRTARDVGSLDAVPLSLEATLAVQIDALDVAARKLLRYASVLGRVFPRAVFEAIVRTHDADADLAALSRLDEFIEHDGDELRFRNGLVRDTTYESVAFRLRTQLHAVAAAEIERRDADSADALALHFSRAGNAEQTWRYARVAAERARKSYANIDAARYYEIALAAAKRMPALDRQEHVAAWTELGDARELAGLFAASLDAYRRALHAAGDDAVTRADLLFGRARAKERAGEFSAALRDLTIGLRLLNDHTTPQAAQARARLRSFAAMVQFGQDKPRRALARAEVAVAEARSADEPLSLGRALIVLDLAHTALEGPGDGAYLKEALAIFEAIGDLRMQANTRANLGFLNAHACRWDEAVEWLRSGRELDLRTGDSVGGAYAGLNIGEILVNQRRFGEAESLLQEARRAMQAAEFDEGVAVIDIQLARILIERGQFAAGRGRDVSHRGRVHSFAEARVRAGSECRARRSASGSGERRCGTRRPRPRCASGRIRCEPDPPTHRTCAGARACLARPRSPMRRIEIDSGLIAAREHALRYDEALLLAIRAEVASDGRADEDRAASEKILKDLGVLHTPRSEPMVAAGG